MQSLLQAFMVLLGEIQARGVVLLSNIVKLTVA